MWKWRSELMWDIWVVPVSLLLFSNYHLASLPQPKQSWGYLIRKEVLQMPALFPKELYFFKLFFFIYSRANCFSSVLASVEKGLLWSVSFYVLHPLQCPFSTWKITAWQRNTDPVNVKHGVCNVLESKYFSTKASCFSSIIGVRRVHKFVKQVISLNVICAVLVMQI